MIVTTAQGMELRWSRVAPENSLAEKVLDVQGLVVSVGIRRVIDNLTFSLSGGEVVYVAGPNGSGKSTLLNAIAGTGPAKIEDGKILFLGTDITLLPTHKRAALGISYMMQRNNVFEDLTVEENLFLALGPDGRQGLTQRFPEWSTELPSDKRAGLLSGGQKQKLAWAMASLRSAKLLLADEPERGISETNRVTEHVTCLRVNH